MRRWRGPGWLGVVLVGVLTGCSSPPPVSASADEATDLRVEVLERFPHDPEAFTQGLELHDGLLYEGTGLRGRSEIRVVEPDTGEVITSRLLDQEYFGEGITLVGDRLWQLTWQAGVAFLRDRDTLAERSRVSYQGEGWGLCHQSERDRLVMSDGTAELTFRDPETFESTGSVTVTRDGERLTMLNELECVDGLVWANVWQTDEIVRIDPATGSVTGTVDAAGLLDETERAGADVLNGIAALPDGDTFYLTGKLWPTVFKVRFVPA